MWRRSMLVGALALGIWTVGAQAGDHDLDRQRAERLQAAGQVMPLQEVLNRVAIDYPGQVLKVEFEEASDQDDCQDESPCPEQWIYELKILQDEGRLAKIKVDARTGQVLWVGRRHNHERGSRR